MISKDTIPLPGGCPRPRFFLVLAVIIMSLASGTLSLVFAEGETDALEIGRWYPELESGLNFTQSAYSDNWSGGDLGTVVWTAILNGSLRSRLNESLDFSNTLKLAYGQTLQQKSDGSSRSWSKPLKSTDRIDYESILRLTLGSWVDPYVSGRLESQFQDASDPFQRNLLFNPLLIKESGGVSRQFIDEEHRSLLMRLGGTFRQSVRRQFSQDAPSRESTSESTNDGGIELVTDYKGQILEDKVAWTSKLSFYKPLFYSGKDDLESLSETQLRTAGLDPDIADFTTTVDIDWENIFSTQITKLISVNLYVRWVYDKYDNSVKPVLTDVGELEDATVIDAAVRKAGQFKQTLAIGVTYRFF